MNNLPRLDVGYSAMIAAIGSLAMMAFSVFVLGVKLDPVALATLPNLAVVAVFGIVAYVFPRNKELFGGVAGAVVVLIQAYLSSRAGATLDTPLVTTAFTYLLQLLFVLVIPRIQPTQTGMVRQRS